MHQARVSEILASLRQGQATDAEKEELIIGFMDHAKRVARTVGRKYSRIIEDLEGEARLELTEAINRIFDGKKVLDDDQLGKYLTRSIAYRCKDAIEKIRIMYMASRTMRLQLAEGLNDKREMSDRLQKLDMPYSKKWKIAKIPVMYQDAIIDEAKELDGVALDNFIRSKLYEILPLPKIVEALAKDPEDAYTPYGLPEARRELGIEVLELLKKAAQGPIDQKIIELRMEGYRYQEIGPMVGLHWNSICRRLTIIEERYDFFNRY